ncbi:MAG: hypothetical protein IPK21_04020 [Haliscomenobacter sp.]|nr:hypothetical protein [Haliscomenobacter sp.]
MDIQRLVRPNILKLVPYSSARSEFKGSADIFWTRTKIPSKPASTATPIRCSAR